MTDPTSLRRIEELEARLAAVEAERRELRAILASLSPVVLRVALDGTITYVNRVLPQYAQRPPVGESIYTYAPPEHHAAMRGAIETAVRTGAPAELESVASAPDGTRGWYQTVVAPIRAGGEIVAVTFTSTDVTRLKAAEQAIRERRDLDHLALDAGNVGVWRWDCVDDVVTWNEKLCSMFGVAPADAPKTAADFLALVSEDQRPAMQAHIEASVASGTYMDFELRVDLPEGTRWYVIKGGATRGAAGEVVGLLGGVVDNTELRRLMEVVRESQKLEAVGQLAAGVAHNFNNMLAGIVPVLSIAQRTAPAHLVSYLRDAEHSALRAADLVRDLMAIGRKAAGDAATRPREPLSTVIGRVTDLCRRTFDRRIAIESAIEPDATQVAVEGVQMEQALLNLMLNARDAIGGDAARPARIHVTASRVDEDAGRPAAIELRVRDTGAGMDEATRARVFEPFFTTKPVGSGTGLGLVTAWAAVKAHGGTLLCDSTPGVGTVFWFRLPLDGGASAPDRIERPSAAKAAVEARCSVLVIDDEEPVRRATTMILRAEGYEVTTASTGLEGVRAFAEAPTDVVLLDYSMPGQGAAFTIAQLRRLRPGVPVVIFSGLEVDVEGASGYLAKPARLDQLVSAIRSATRGEIGAAPSDRARA